MAVPYTFGNATTSIPLSQLDTNFATAITIGNTAVYLGNTTTTFGNVTLNNVTINSGNSTVTKETVTTITSPAATALTIQSAGTTAMTIDTSQNVGIGVTPSAWVDIVPVQVKNAGFAGFSNYLYATANTYYDGTNWRYIASDYATRYQQVTGQHQWLTAPSGTAGAVGTFTQAMTLDSSGNVGIGTTSPSSYGKLAISNGTVVLTNNVDTANGYFGTSTNHPLQIFTNNAIRMYFDTSGNVGIGTSSPSTKLEVSGGITASGGNVIKATAGVNIDRSGNDAYLLLQQSSAGGGQIRSIAAGGFKFTDNGAATEWMRIDSSGNVGIGTTSPNIGGANTDNAILTLKGKASTRGGIFEMGNFGTTGNDQTLGWNRYFDGSTENASIEVARASSTSTAYMKFSTNGGSGNTERARIDSSGNLLVGGTTSGATGVFSVVPNSQGVGASPYLNFNKSGSGGLTQMYFQYNGSTKGSISYNDTSTAFNTTSDYRLKENIQSMQDALATVSQLNPVTYIWKENGSAGQGFIAHELQAVVPDCVTGEKDAVDENGKPIYQGVDTSFLVATLVKAIQELKAEIDALKGTK